MLTRNVHFWSIFTDKWSEVSGPLFYDWLTLSTFLWHWIWMKQFYWSKYYHLLLGTSKTKNYDQNTPANQTHVIYGRLINTQINAFPNALWKHSMLYEFFKNCAQSREKKHQDKAWNKASCMLYFFSVATPGYCRAESYRIYIQRKAGTHCVKVILNAIFSQTFCINTRDSQGPRL